MPLQPVSASATWARRHHRGPGPALMGSQTLRGNPVYNTNGEHLGEITEFMLDVSSGQIAYAVLSFAGFLKIRHKLFALPWQALTLDTANRRFLLEIARERLVQAPGFDPNHWPSMADETWALHVHDIDELFRPQ